jgi:hypothetical protein
MAANDLVIFRNIALTDADTGGQTSTVGEPSVANNGAHIFVTGNWYATASVDGGASWNFVSPFNTLPAADAGFCCDQTALYDPGRDLLFWILQYITRNHSNTLRIAVKRGATLGNSDWYWWDFRPAGVNSAWTREWFDFNHAALGRDYLYVTTNAFTTTTPERFTRCVVLRLPLDTLADGSSLDYRYFQTEQNFSLRATPGARDVMYFASHNNTRQLRLFTWPEAADTASFTDIAVTPWREGAMRASGPDGRNWLARSDSRITAGWLARAMIGFAWTANTTTGRPLPYVRVVRIDERSRTVIDEPDIWKTDFAYAYPDTCPNDAGDIGITLFRGGGSIHPGHVVGIFDDATRRWRLASTRTGTHGPADSKWGDYLAIRRRSPDGLTWLATGFTLQGGGGFADIEPRIVHFGWRRYSAAAARWSTA